MSDVSIAEAKAHLTRLVHEAEGGTPVRITRRGKPVAVLVAESEFQRLRNPGRSFLSFVEGWRADFVAQGLSGFTDDELDGLRDRSDRPDIDLV